MSHRATNWAIQQRGLMPATKLVLWYLCDRHTPDFGCYPSQDQLAADAEISRASLNTHLRKLEEAGLIRRQATAGRTGHKAAEIDPLPARLRGRLFAKAMSRFWTWKWTKAMSKSGTKSRKAMSKSRTKPCPDSGHELSKKERNYYRA